MNQFIITLDIDWAPDFVIESVANSLKQHHIHATWFVTHDSRAVRNLRQSPDLFELGIHPNFLQGSSHGDTPSDVLKHMLEIVPEARSLRSHAIVHSGPIINTIATETNIKFESNAFLPNMPHIQASKQYFSNEHYIWRIPFFWADDHEMIKPKSDWRLAKHLSVQGVKVFMFHPIHIYLNSASFDPYQSLKKTGIPFNQLNPEDIAPFIQSDAGTGTLFQELIQHLRNTESKRLCDIEGISFDK